MAQPNPTTVSDQSVSSGPRTSPNIAGEPLNADICVIGGGAGGLQVAAAAAAFGRQVVLIEKHRMGGEGLTSGSVPSKALLASARRAHALRTASDFGIASVDPQIDHRVVHHYVRRVIAATAPNSSVERITGLGVRVILGAARFLDKRTVLAGDYRVTARRFVIATGSAPSVPDIPGLENVSYFTSDSIFDNDRKLSHLVVVGAGPVGLELAQAHLRLGSRVTVLDAGRALAKEDPEASSVALRALRAEGLDIREGIAIERLESLAGLVRLHVTTETGPATIDGSHLLFATGRTPNVSDLNLDAAGIKHGPEGIVVNRGLRTSNSRTYAIGDVIAGGARYTHASTAHAEVVLRRALFWLPAKTDPALIPRVTFTDPEIAHVGLTEDEARAAGHKINVLRWPFTENDRAEAERETTGHVKVVTSARGRILGATIVGREAGELIHIWSLAVSQRLGIKAVAHMIAPYPTRGEASRRAAYRYYAATPSNPTLRKLIDFLARLG